MTKSETVNTYINSLVSMDNMLTSIKANFDHEVKAIIGIKKETLKNLDIIYNDDKTKLMLLYRVNPEIVGEENYNDAYVTLSVVDFISETFYNPKNEGYNKFINKSISLTLEELNKLRNEKNILLENSNKFLFRLTHKNIDTAILNITNAINEVIKIKQNFEEDYKNMNSMLDNNILKCFIEEVKHVYGFMDLKLKIGGD